MSRVLKVLSKIPQTATKYPNSVNFFFYCETGNYDIVNYQLVFLNIKCEDTEQYFDLFDNFVGFLKNY